MHIQATAAKATKVGDGQLVKQPSVQRIDIIDIIRWDDRRHLVAMDGLTSQLTVFNWKSRRAANRMALGTRGHPKSIGRAGCNKANLCRCQLTVLILFIDACKHACISFSYIHISILNYNFGTNCPKTNLKRGISLRSASNSRFT